ncbi:MAG: hypothetical protein MIO92_06225 [Methanosarcinaceae archaeon]|nr:hypothetical protein [Methanosarcinaceae archaeon]
MLIEKVPYKKLSERGILKITCNIRVITLMATLVLSVGLFKRCVAFDKAYQNTQGANEITPVIKENTVVFWAISQTDYDLLIAENPKLSSRMEELWDYYRYSEAMVPKLEALGFTVIRASWKEANIQLGKRKMKKIQINPREFKALLLYRKGKKPMLVTKFTGEYWSMAKILSDYFGLDFSIWDRK